MPKARNNQDSKIETYLSVNDRERFLSLCRQKHASQSSLARDAIRFYLEHHDQLSKEKSESHLTQVVKNCFERAIAILARQNVEIGTLYELAWQNHQITGDDERFIAVVNNVKQRLRKKLVDDERKIAEGMKNKIMDKAG